MKNNNFQFFIILTVILTISTSICAKTWYVNKDGSGDATYISTGLYYAQPGDTVLVAPGVYNETTLLIEKFVFLISTHGPDNTTIDHYGTPSEPLFQVFLILNFNGDVYIDGFTVTGAQSGWDEIGGGFYILSSNGNITITNCIIRENWCATAGGIAITASANVTVHNNLILANEGFTCAAMYIRDCSPIITNNTIVFNYASIDGAGICVSGDSWPIISHNIITNNYSPICAGVCGDSLVTISDNFFCNNVYQNRDDEYYRPGFNPVGLRGNISADPMFCGEWTSHNYYLQSNSPCAEPNVPEYCSGIRIGYYPINCETGTERSSWGRIKKRSFTK